MDGQRPVRAEHLAGFQHLAELRARPTPRQDTTSPEMGPAAQIETPADPFSGDPKLYKDYALVHVLLLGGKVSDLVREDRADRSPPPAEPPPLPEPARPQASMPSVGERITVSVETRSIEIDVRQGESQVSVEIEMQSIQVWREPLQKSDPLVLDLDGDGVEIGTVAKGVAFDITGDGARERTATAIGGDGFLALDRDGDGAITSGRELFGDQHGAINGFAELARFDQNTDSVIDAQDRVFEQLRIWRDDNRDGVSAARELLTLPELGITAIDLAYRVDDQTVAESVLAQRGSFRRADGTAGEAADVLLAYRP